MFFPDAAPLPELPVPFKALCKSLGMFWPHKPCEKTRESLAAAALLKVKALRCLQLLAAVCRVPNCPLYKG